MESLTLIDDFFTVTLRTWGTYASFDKNGEPLVTSLTEEDCIAATRFFLKQRQDGFPS